MDVYLDVVRGNGDVKWIRILRITHRDMEMEDLRMKLDNLRYENGKLQEMMKIDVSVIEQLAEKNKELLAQANIHKCQLTSMTSTQEYRNQMMKVALCEKI